MNYGRSSRGRSYATILLLCLGIFGRIWGELHHASVAHTVCAEHGELIEVAQPQEDCSGDATHQGPRLFPHEDEHGHEHCIWAELCREKVAQWASGPARLVQVHGCRGANLAPQDNDTENVARILLAPKHSPPDAVGKLV